MSKRILIVDDEARNRSLLAAMVEPIGYEAKTATNGIEALEKLDSAVDLVLLDILMPGMDGFEVLERIRDRMDVGDIPIIVVTSLDGKDDRVRAIKLGANDFISKPIDRMELRVRIASLLRIKETQDALRFSERKYRTLVETARDVIWTVDPDLRYTYVSPSVTTALGYSVDEMMAMGPLEGLTPLSQARILSALGEELAREAAGDPDTHRSRSEEIQRYHKDGSRVWAEVTTSFLRDGEAKPVGILGVSRDITDRKKAEEAIRQSERRFRDLVELLPHFVFEVDPEGKFVFMNPSGLAASGYTNDDLQRGLTLSEIIAPRDRNRLLGNFSRVIRGKRSRGNEYMLIRKDGTELPIISYSVPIMGEDGPIGLRGVAVDITEIKSAHDALRESEEKYRTLFENAGDAIFILETEDDKAGRIVSANRVAAEMHGYSPGELLGMNISELEAPEEIHKLPKRIARIRRGEWIKEEILHRKKDGTMFPVEITARLLPLRDHAYILAIDRDISSRKVAEQEIRASEQKYRMILETIADGYHEVDLKGNLTLVNDSLCEILGYPREELLGTNYRQLVTESSIVSVFRAYNTVFGTGVPNSESSFEIVRKDGKKRWVSVSIALVKDATGRPAGFRGVFRDITQRRSLEEQLNQAAKMEAIGKLAGGIAHDFNNLLTAIQGYSTMLRDQLSERGIVSDKLEQIERSAQRAAELTRQLLAFSRRQILEVKVINLNNLIQDMEGMLSRLIGENIELVTVLDQRLGNVKGDPAQLGQIILNLAVNGRDAMPKGGRLTIETTNAVIDATYSHTHGEPSPGTYVTLSVTDTGEGMDGETCSRIFEPFFTTKGPDAGTGLGLSTAYGIVKQHQGHCTVYSEPGQGTVFKICLPLVDEDVTCDPEQPFDQHKGEGTETILLVEDEDAVRGLAGEALELLGYTILKAASPREAIALVSDYPSTIHLLLTDVVLPQMDGKSLFEYVRARRPHIKVLFMSGYTEDFIVHHGVLHPGLSFLPKPFSIELMARKVREVLDSPTNQAAIEKIRD